MTPYRNDLEAAHARIAFLERDNARLADEIRAMRRAQTLRPVKRRATGTVLALVAGVFVAGICAVVNVAVSAWRSLQ